MDLARKFLPPGPPTLVVSCGLLLAAVASGQASAPSWHFDGSQPGAHLGVSVSSAGDVNRDGYSDVLVGAPDNDHGQVDEGIAYLFLGSPAGLSPAPAWTQEGDQAGARFGSCVASGGDVNGDGYGDVLIGAPGYDDGHEDEGAVLLYLGIPGGLSASPVRVLQGNQAGSRLGFSVGCAGDVNSDGFDDVLAGAPGFDGGQIDEGAAFVYLGSASGVPPFPVWSAEGNQPGASFGSSVAALGDINGDGFGDIVIGAPNHDGGQLDEGQARVFGGNASGLAASPLQSLEQNSAGSHFGATVAGAGDLTGDGSLRVLFGGPTYTYTHPEEGGTFLALLGQSPFFLDFGHQDFAHRGSSIASAGDVNADGLMDVVIGADRYDDGEVDEGRVTLHLGHSGFVVDRNPSWIVNGNQPSCSFGSSVASAGDVNGDGYADVLVGAPLFDGYEADEGRAFLFMGPSGVVTSVEAKSPAPLPARIRVFPSPGSETAFIEGNRISPQGVLQAHVHDLHGRLLHTYAIGHASGGGYVRAAISTKDLAAGMYFIRLTGEDGVAAGPTQRLVVVR